MDRIDAIVYSHFALILDARMRRSAGTVVKGKLGKCCYLNLSVVLDET